MSTPEGLFSEDLIERRVIAPLPKAVIPVDYVPEHYPAESDREIVVNHEQVDRVLDTLMDTYESNGFPYYLDSTRVPHDPRHVPEHYERGDLDKAMFLWTVCYYMRGGTKSTEAVKSLTSVYQERPDLFDCEIAADADRSEIAELLKDNGLGFQDTVSEAWVTNAARMRDRWDGDPRNIFDGVDTYEESLKRVKNNGRGSGFKGFREKMTSMILYYLMDEKMIDEFMFPLPVDIHVMRISVANELVSIPGSGFGERLNVPKLAGVLRDVYVDYAERRGTDMLRLCNAVWLLSEAICGKHPGNVTLEPLGRKNRDKGRATYLIPKPVDQKSDAQQADYDASCAHCPIEQTCEYTIPGKPYYVSGVVYKRGPRERFEPIQPDLF